MIITLYKVGKDGKTHYYTVHDRQPVLDSPYALCASWRVGLGKERERLHRFESLLDRDKMIRRLISARDQGRIQDPLHLLARPASRSARSRDSRPRPRAVTAPRSCAFAAQANPHTMISR